MRRVEIGSLADTAVRDRLVAAIESIAAASGRPALSDHLWLDLLAGGAPGFRVVTVSEQDEASGERVLAVAQASAANEGLVMEVAAAPGVDAAVALDAADTLLDAIARSGGGAVTWWVDDADDAVRSLAAASGLTPARELHEMRRPLPHPDRSAVVTRGFVPGVDDAAFLTVNNRAFAGHGEQGGWTTDTLALRLREPWFDPDGFRLYEEDGRLLGFCWTKVHDDEVPPVGEIYVIGVDPDAHGRGLGRALTLAGLGSLADRGITVANLYVDAANDVAVALYNRLGFVVHRTRAAFSGTLGAP
jgi:mycothiol synthase